MNLLVEQGYVDAYAMGRLIAFDYIGFWEKFKPIVEGMKARFGDTALMDLDLLYASMKKVAGDIVVRRESFTSAKLGSQ